jgi:precorrin-6A/cobalt-precorrin-6A reductase
MTGRVLVLGGTAEARAIAQALDDAGLPVTSSLAGRVSRPRLPAGDVRIGAFGGPAGLAHWLGENGICAVVDATHPFAQRISASARRAATSAGVPLLRLDRPGWKPSDGDDWHWVDDLAAAASAITGLGTRRVFLTTGRQGLEIFADHRAWFLIRCVDPPVVALPEHHELLLARGPYTLEAELALIDAHEIDVLVTKNSGGSLTLAKLHAARLRNLPVIVVRRPTAVQARTVLDLGEAIAWAMLCADGPDAGVSPPGRP